ncbi:MAG: SecY-interacting protein Syd, partial [Alteromonas sp.]
MNAKNIAQSLDNFIDSYLQSPIELTVEFDNDWLSPCTKQDCKDGDTITWRPVKQEGENSFTAMEAALELKMDEQ